MYTDKELKTKAAELVLKVNHLEPVLHWKESENNYVLIEIAATDHVYGVLKSIQKDAMAIEIKPMHAHKVTLRCAQCNTKNGYYLPE